MKKKFALGTILLLSVVFLSGCSLKKAPSALQVKTIPPANVFVDGKLLGKTPYQGSDWQAGEYSVKLVPETTSDPLASWEGKVKLNPGVLTLVDYNFGSTESAANGEILTLEDNSDKEKASLTVISNPDGSLVNIDGEAKGFTPLTVEEIGEGDHQILVSKDGFKESSVKAKTLTGFKLIANVKLAQEGSFESTTSASVSPTPVATQTETGTETESESGTTANSSSGQVEIKETPTGWLRVRSGPSTSDEEVGKVNPGEKYDILDEKYGWYLIEYEAGEEGWIAGQYATKF